MEETWHEQAPPKRVEGEYDEVEVPCAECGTTTTVFRFIYDFVRQVNRNITSEGRYSQATACIRATEIAQCEACTRATRRM